MRIWRRIRENLKERRLKLKIVYLSLTYNHHCNLHYVLDTLIEPVIWFIDNYVRRFGPVFVGFLMSMMGLVIAFAYLVVVPYEFLRRPWAQVVFYFLLGHWLLINTVFHYVMGYITPPGFPPQGHLISEAVGICKLCIAPKPPRTHHCRICNRCILKMDHHCPWLNQCVGHFNHRYFFLTMIFMWLSCLFIVIGMWPCFSDHYWSSSEELAPWCSTLESFLFYSSILCRRSGEGSVDAKRGISAHNAILFEFFVAAAMVVGLGALIAWHIRLIGRGETSIENHINDQMKRKCKQKFRAYRNPYDFGWKLNWQLFLGLDEDRRSFWRHGLLPSRHGPRGDGLSWATATYQLSSDVLPNVVQTVIPENSK